MPRPSHLPTLAVLLLLAPALASAAEITAETPPPSTILGGEVVGPCGWPNVVSLGDDEGGGFCSGTLIHPQLVLYAAHCGDEVGWIRFTDAIDNPEKREVVPEFCATHPVGEFGFGTDFAFCRLPAPITDVPITPPLVGCDVEATLKVGEPVTLVGFGVNDDPDPDKQYGIKRAVETSIMDFSWNEVFVGDESKGACYGDSGGPAALQLADGSWRIFGITSWGQGGCGAGNYFSLVHNGVDWIESTSGLDITPCTTSDGAWDPSAACGGFASGDPGSASGAWDSCAFAGVSGPSMTCGAAFDPAPDTAPPVVTIINPSDGSHLNGVGGKGVSVVIEVDASDVGWGTESVTLRILDGVGDKELFVTEDAAAPFIFPELDFASGLWTLEAIGVDRAGNQSEPARSLFGVNTIPPPTMSETTGSETTGSETTGSAATSDESSSGDTGATSAGVTPDDGGCNCTSGSPGSPAILGLGILMLGFARRRRIALLGALGAVPSGCSDGGETVSESATSSASATETTAGETTSTSTDGGTDASTDASTDATTGEPVLCGNGGIDGDEACDDGNAIDGDGCNADCTPSGAIRWQVSVPGSDFLNALAIDGAGTLVAAGGVGDEAWVGAFTPEGAPLWSDTFTGASGQAFFRDAAIDGDEIVLVGGAENTGKLSRGLLVRYTADGTRLGTTYVDDPEIGYANMTDVVIDGAGAAVAVLIAGDPLRTTLRAFDDEGAVAWSLAIADDLHDGGLARASDGTILAAFRETVDKNQADLMIARVDNAGALLWKKSHGDPLTRYYVFDVAVDPNDAPVVVGSISRTSAADTAISGLTASGDLAWQARPALPGPGWDEAYGAIADADGSVVFAGAGFGKDSVDMWYGRLSASGEVLWAHTMASDGPYVDSANDVVILPSGELVLAGTFAVDGERQGVLVGLNP